MLSKRLQFLLVIAFGIFHTTIQGQIVANMVSYSTANGLSDNRVTYILKDQSGFMWFGSWAGLNRFDGTNFLTFKSNPGDNSSLKNNRIDEIVEDKDNLYLWVKTYDNLVYCFNKRTHKFIPLSVLINDRSNERSKFQKILAVRGNELWLKTIENGIISINYKANSSSDPLINKFQIIVPRNSSFFHLDKFNNAWIGKQQGVLYAKKLNTGQLKIYSVKEFQDTKISGVAEGKSQMWLATSEKKLIAIDLDLKNIKNFVIPKGVINHILVSKIRPLVYCSTSVGMLYSISNNGTIQKLVQVSTPLYYMFEQKSGMLWVESERWGSIKYSPESRSIDFPFPNADYQFKPWVSNYMLLEDRNHVVWTNATGDLRYYKESTKKLIPFSTSESPTNQTKIRRLFLDTDGVIWYGSGTEGIQKLIVQERHFTLRTAVKQQTLENLENDIRGLIVDHKNRQWVGTKSGTVKIYKDNKEVDLFSTPFKNIGGIYCILEDDLKRVWLGSKGGGIVLAKPNANGKYDLSYLRVNNAVKESNSIYSLYQDTHGRIWAGSFGNALMEIVEKEGEIYFKTIQSTFKQFPVNIFNKIRCIAEDKAGWIWLGTTDGLVMFNPQQGKRENYKFKTYQKIPNNINSLGGNDVQFILEGSSNRMWVLTATGGLNLAQSANHQSISFTNFSKKNGLPSDVLLSCVEDKERNIWIATQNGISKLTPGKNKFQNFNYSEGMGNVSFSESSAARTKEGNLVFGTASGCLLFDPVRIKQDKASAQMALTGIQINSENITPDIGDSPLELDINETSRIELNHDQNLINIDFAVLDYHQLDKPDYEFRLIGFDDVWRSTEGQTRASYTRLPPGEYTFQVRSLNEERYEKLPFHQLHIIIKNPPWKSFWAFAIYLILIATLIFLIRRLALTFFNLKQGIVVERQMAELKLGFFTQISHELRTPLTLIINPSEEVMQKESLTEKGKAHMSVVIKNSRRMLRMVNQVLDLRKIQSGKDILQLQNMDVIYFIRTQLEYFHTNLEQRKIKVEVVTTLNKLNALIDPVKLEIVLFNAFANAVKFSPDGGVIKVFINKHSEKFFRIAIVDEGPGVADKELSDIFKLYYQGKPSTQYQAKGTGIGLSLSKELITLHKGKIWAENNKPFGLNLLIELGLEMGQYDLDNVTEHTSLASSLIQDYSGRRYHMIEDDAIEQGSEKLTLLLVEDNEELRDFLAVKFGEEYHIKTAKDGVEGLEIIKIQQPHLILSDIMMPRMDGLKLLDIIKNDAELSHLPVILLTAKNAVENQIEALKYGADYYITKPFDLHLLETAIENILKQRRRAFVKLQQPNDLQEVESRTFTQYDQNFLQRVLEVVEAKLTDPNFNVEEAADLIGMSRSSFYRKFKSLTGIAPVEFVRDTRVRKGKEILDEGEDNVSVVAYSVGFSTPKYFSICFRTIYGQNPSEYVKTIRKKY